MKKYKEKKKELLAMSTFVKFLRATDSVSSLVHNYLPGINLTVSQFGVLEALYHKGPMCQRDIAKKILKSSGNITTVVDNLEKRGLVIRERDSNDRRYYNVVLTAEGEQLIKGIFPAHVHRIVQAMGKLNMAEQKELGRLCKKLTL